MSIVGIIHPFRIGDTIQLLPIAKCYADRGDRVVWPVEKHLLPMFNYVDYVEVIDVGSRHTFLPRNYVILKRKCERKLKAYGVDRSIDLTIGCGGLSWEEFFKFGLHFDQWRYREAGVPFGERFNLSIRRNRLKELELTHMLSLPKSYVVTHSVGISGGRHDWGIPGAVEVRPIPGYTVFDWIGVIELADHVYCVDSCIANLVNQLGIAKGRRTFRPWPQQDPLLTPSIDWGEG